MEEVNKICTMSRPSPFDKLLMVQCLKPTRLSMRIQGNKVAKVNPDILIFGDSLSIPSLCHTLAPNSKMTLETTISLIY